MSQYMLVPLPCGYCAACRRDRLNMWIDRLTFEASGKPSTFLTLTYDDKHLPPDKSVHLEDWQRFHDRLRHKVQVKYKYFVTSEYGSQTFRPHMHACLIGLSWENFDTYQKIYDAWENKGFISCSTLNPSRIRYCLKYISKEWKNEYKNDYELRGLKPLFHTMSKGIGRDWLFEHIDDIRKNGGYYVNGKLRPIPRYYQDLLHVRDDLTPRDFIKYCDKYKQYNKVGKDYSPMYSHILDSSFTDSARLNHLEKKEFLDEFNTLI